MREWCAGRWRCSRTDTGLNPSEEVIMLAQTTWAEQSTKLRNVWLEVESNNSLIFVSCYILQGSMIWDWGMLRKSCLSWIRHCLYLVASSGMYVCLCLPLSLSSPDCWLRRQNSMPWRMCVGLVTCGKQHTLV